MSDQEVTLQRVRDNVHVALIYNTFHKFNDDEFKFCQTVLDIVNHDELTVDQKVLQLQQYSVWVGENYKPGSSVAAAASSILSHMKGA